MFAPPPAPMMREYCERDTEGTGPLLDEDDGEQVGHELQKFELQTRLVSIGFPREIVLDKTTYLSTVRM